MSWLAWGLPSWGVLPTLAAISRGHCEASWLLYSAMPSKPTNILPPIHEAPKVPQIHPYPPGSPQPPPEGGPPSGSHNGTHPRSIGTKEGAPGDGSLPIMGMAGKREIASLRPFPPITHYGHHSDGDRASVLMADMQSYIVGWIYPVGK